MLIGLAAGHVDDTAKRLTIEHRSSTPLTFKSALL